MSPRRVLIVEDDRDIAESLCDVLLDDGFEVCCAGNGRRALELLEKGLHPDVILLDLMMQGMNGVEFRRLQLARPQLARFPVVVMTATRDAARAEELAPQGWIHKPFELDELLETVRRCAALDPAA